jgi:hypothetical protein
MDPLGQITDEMENLWSGGGGLPPIKTQGTGTSARWKVSYAFRCSKGDVLFARKVEPVGVEFTRRSSNRVLSSRLYDRDLKNSSSRAVQCPAWSVI